MTRISRKRLAYGVAPLLLITACVSSASAHETSPSDSGTPEGSTAAPAAEGHSKHTATNAPAVPLVTTAPPAAGARPGTVTIVRGTPVANIRQTPADRETSNYCDASDLPAGEGKADKGNTCVSTPIGEIADHPVRVTTRAPFLVRKSAGIRVRIVVADNQGILDLNAFTFDATGGAGTTLHERPGELDANGRPLLHCHLGVTTLRSFNALPGEDYDAAFSGIQGFKGDVTAKITGLPRGTYRGDVYCSVPGHPQLPTSKATEVQAFDTFDFQVIGK
jgi:hypothetical protein